MRVLVTGAAGFVGMHLVRTLAEQGCQVVALDNFARGAADDEWSSLVERENVSVCTGDVTASSSFEQLSGTFDEIYHLAAINGTANFYKRPDEVFRVGILGTLQLLDWYVRGDHGPLLYSSSSETYAGTYSLLGDAFPLPTPEDVPLAITDPSNMRWSYGASKIASEIALHGYAGAGRIQDFRIVRYHNVYGPRMGDDHVVPQFCQRLIAGDDPFIIYGAEQTRSFCYVEDAVQATQHVMRHSDAKGETIHIGREDEISIERLAQTLFKVAGHHPRVANRSAPSGSVARRCPSTKKLQALGYEATTKLTTGLEKTFTWYKQRA